MLYPFFIPSIFEYQTVRPVNEIDFGVYKQQTAKTTVSKKVFSLAYDYIKQEDANIIETFLDQNRGKEFTFKNELDGKSYTVRMKGDFPKFSFVEPGYRRIETFILEEI